MTQARKRDVAIAVTFTIIGWAAARLVLPQPSIMYVSPVVQCGGAHVVDVPFRDNATWAVQAGKRFWSSRNGGEWTAAPYWYRQAGRVLVAPASDGIRLIAKAYGAGSIAGATIGAAEVKPMKEKAS